MPKKDTYRQFEIHSTYIVYTFIPNVGIRPLKGRSAQNTSQRFNGRSVLDIKVKLHYAYKLRNLVRCIRDCAVALLRFCGLQTPQKRNGLFTLAWHRTEFDGCLRVITSRQFENFRHPIFTLTSQHYFSINGNFEKLGSIEII